MRKVECIPTVMVQEQQAGRELTPLLAWVDGFLAPSGKVHLQAAAQ